MAHLTAWCETGPQVCGLLVYAPGGTGKTRLARELGRVMHHRGWVVGELSDSAADFSPLTQMAGPMLLLIDYAETRAKATASLLLSLAERRGQHPVRVLLLARSAGRWWDTLLEDELIAAVLPYPPYPLNGVEYVFEGTEELNRLADALHEGLSRLPDYEAYDAPPAFDLPWRMAHNGTHHPLTLHIAVLASLLTQRDGTAAQHNPPEKILMRHEKRYWNRLAAERSVGFPETRELVLVFCLLCGAHSKTQALTTVSLVPGFQSEALENERRVLAHWIACLYPPADPRTDYWGLLTPDWLFEYLLTEIVQDEPALLKNLTRTNEDRTASRLTGAQLHRALTVLTAAAAHGTPDAYTLRRQLGELVAVHNGVLLPTACIVSTQVVDPTPLLAAVEVVVRSEAAQLRHLNNLRRFLPPVGGVLGPAGLALQQRIVAFQRAERQPDAQSAEGQSREDQAPCSPEHECSCGSLPHARTRRLAEELHLLGTYLAAAGKVQEAAEASAEAVRLFVECPLSPGQNPWSYIRSLTNHATNLARTGEWDESYRLATRVIELIESVGRTDITADFDSCLISVLNTLYLYHSRRGESDEAKAALSRAVELQRQALSATGGHPFDWLHLGELLQNQATWLAEHGDRGEAIRVATECVDIFRRLYRASSGVYAQTFQDCAQRLADLLAQTGRHSEAAALYGEAAEAQGRLWSEDHARYQLKLGMTLVKQARELSGAGAPPAVIVHVLARSCRVLQRLFQQNPQATARHYIETLKYFIQGAQLVETDVDIKPYMHEVAEALDHVLSSWERAGLLPGDDDTTIKNLAMFLAWAVKSGLWSTAVSWCERLEHLLDQGAGDGAGTEVINRRALRVISVMWRAKALIRLGEHASATSAARAGTNELTEPDMEGNHQSAYVAAEALFDIAGHLADAGATEDSLELLRLGAGLGRTHVDADRTMWTGLHCNHLVHAAVLESRRGDHEAAAELLAEALPHDRWLSRELDVPLREPLVGFTITPDVQNPGYTDNLDKVLSLYAQELRALGRLDDLAGVLTEQVAVRQALHDKEPTPHRALDWARAGAGLARHLQDTEHPDEAAAVATASIAVLERHHYDTEDHRHQQAVLLHWNAVVLAEAGRSDDAMTAATQSVALFKALQSDGQPHSDVADAVCDLAAILSKAERYEEALVVGGEALQMYRAQYAQDPSMVEALAMCLYNQILTLGDLGREEEQLTLLTEYDALLEETAIEPSEDSVHDPAG
ncbi:tetratricopeptide (TPR) repeat protein [Streptomyces sp. V4I8]|uniref:hypothetical protein n=1 Tax=Streptomyces sp. V4I8 TaxID=3156469 RepID=UPI003514E882